MKSRLCVWLGTLVVCVIATDAWAGKKSAEPKRDSRILIEPAQLQKKLNDPTLRILDVRSVEQYSKGHIPGAGHNGAAMPMRRKRSRRILVDDSVESVNEFTTRGGKTTILHRW